MYMKCFLCAYVEISEDVWQEREADPAWKASSERAWSIDALQQYLMQQIALARKRIYLERDTSSGNEWSSRPECTE